MLVHKSAPFGQERKTLCVRALQRLAIRALRHNVKVPCVLYNINLYLQKGTACLLLTQVQSASLV